MSLNETAGLRLNPIFFAGEDLLENGMAVSETNSELLLDNHMGNGKLYTIVMYLTGQQASGVQALINLQCRAHSLNLPLVILEPVIVKNKFKAMATLEFDDSGASLIRRDPVIQFHDLFDLDNFNKVSTDMNYAQLVPRNSFFANAPRKIIFVVLYEGEKNEIPKLIKLWPKRNTLNNSCFDPLTSQLGGDPKYQLYQITQKGFCVVKVILFRMTRGESLVFTEAQLRRSILGGMKITDFTLVFNVWMPKFVLPGVKGRDCIHSGYRSSKGQFQSSKRLLANANYYKERFLNSHNKHLTLMIRLEHVYTFLSRRRSKAGEWSVEKCLNAAIEEVKYFQNEKSFGKPFVTLDIGKYGSKSLRSIGLENVKNNTKYISKLLSSVYGGPWNFEEWENSFTQATGGIVDSSYIAALQRTVASKAECLILVGGGMFQELTMRKYMESHDQEDWCIHFVCIKDKIYSEVEQP